MNDGEEMKEIDEEETGAVDNKTITREEFMRVMYLFDCISTLAYSCYSNLHIFLCPLCRGGKS
jgi:hypothetical protein